MHLECGTILWLEDEWQQGFHIHEQLGGNSMYVFVSLNNVGKLIAINVGVHPSQLESSCQDMNIWYQVSPYCVFCYSNYNPHM
jgi:hypothetical protein